MKFTLKSRRTCTIAAAPGKGKLPTFEGVAYTGAVMPPNGWFGKIVVDLAGLQVPSQPRPVLRQHDHMQIVGHTTAVKATSKGLQVQGILSGHTNDVRGVVEPAKNGFQWQ